MYVSNEVAEIMDKAFAIAKNAHFEYVTPELMLYVACQNGMFARTFAECGGNIRKLERDLGTYLKEYMEQVEAPDNEPQLSQGMIIILSIGWETAQNSEKPVAELSHLLSAMYGLAESYAVYYLRAQGVDRKSVV